MDKYDYIIAAIVIVLFLTTFFTLFAYLLGIYYWIKGRWAESERSSLRRVLEEKVNRSSHLEGEIRAHWKRFEVALPVLFEMDDVHGDDKRWRTIREEYCRKALLPIARKHAGSLNVLHRLLAAKVFSIMCEPEDEVCILKLLRDRIPLVHMEIMLAAPLLPTSNVVNTMIDMMTTHRRKSYALYTKTFHTMPVSAADAVVDRLRREKQPYVRSICYTVLMALNRTDPDLDLTGDLESDVLDLKISAIKYLARSQRSESVQKLTEYLLAPEWQIRVVAIQELGRWKTEETRRQLVAAMRDPKWWVRYNAGLALKNMGEFGLEALRQVGKNDDRFAYDVARHLLLDHQRDIRGEA